MCTIRDLYTLKLREYRQNHKIIIAEVPIGEIKKIIPTDYGCMLGIPDVGSTKYEAVIILIDESLDDGFKLDTLLHEYAHTKAYSSLTYTEIQNFKNSPKEEWTKKQELNSYIFQLTELNKIHTVQCSVLEPFFIKLEKIKQTNNSAYIAAIQELENTGVWKEAVRLRSLKSTN